MRPRRRRRSRWSQEGAINDLVESIQSQLSGSPLSEVGEKLLETVQELRFAAEKDVDWAQIHSDVTAFLERLPDEFGPRFYFDAYHLHSVIDGWSKGAAVFPRTFIPVYRDEWQYEPLPLPGGRRRDGKVHRLYLIGIHEERSQHAAAPPFLLDYAFLCHELAHYLLAKHGLRFFARFNEALEEWLDQQARRRIALRGRARSRSASRSDEIELNWSFGRGGMWAAELAIDVVALWTCGPAYLDALEHYLREHYRDKFQIEPSHPPAVLRSAVLAEAARRLHWTDHVGELESLVNAWMDEGPPSFNRYRALTDGRIVDACLAAAFDYCTWAQLPRLTPKDLSRIRVRVEEENELTGTDLIVAAWLVDYEQGAEAYDEWERKIFEQFVEELEAEL